MRSVLLSAIVVVGVSMPGRVSIGQEAGPGATAEIVRLDAVVTDAQGHLVRDLRASDFELLEDGKARPLTQFLFVGGRGPTPPVAAEVPSVPRSAETAATAGPGRDVVIFVDDLHIARRNFDFMKEALRQFVSGFLGPEDRVAIVTSAGPGGVRELTRDRTVLGAAIDGLAFRQAVVAPARGSQMTPAQAELILRGDPSALQLATRLVMDEPGSVLSGGPRAALEGAGGYTPASVVDTKDRAGAQEALRQARTILAEDLHFSEITLVRVEDVLRSLAALPGRKLCLLVSDGFLVGTGTSDEQTRHLRAVVDAATRCGAVVYALDAHGRTTTGGDTAAAGIPAPPGLRERVERLSAQEFRDTLSRLANDTGGFLVQGGTNEIATGLRRMLEDNEAYYLMAYEPASSKRDGRFRRIELRMPGRPDLTVRTRAGYFAPDDRKGAPKRGERASMPLALGDAEHPGGSDRRLPRPAAGGVAGHRPRARGGGRSSLARGRGPAPRGPRHRGRGLRRERCARGAAVHAPRLAGPDARGAGAGAAVGAAVPAAGAGRAGPRRRAPRRPRREPRAAGGSLGDGRDPGPRQEEAHPQQRVPLFDDRNPGRGSRRRRRRGDPA
jgi:VWFA-related protein